MKKSKVSIVIPVYRSQESLPILVNRLMGVSAQIDREIELIFVDDCSPDNSWEVLKQLKYEHKNSIKIARLLTNCGQHNAVLCGFSMSTGDPVVTMDDDLQNPPEEITKLIEAIDHGYDLAIGAYDGKKHSVFRNICGGLVDWIQRRLFNLPKDFQLTSFRAAKKIVIENVCEMGGVFPYVTAMLISNSSKYCNVAVKHEPRVYGKSNYTIRNSLALVSNLIFSYSSYPLYFILLLCVFAIAFSFIYGVRVLLRAILYSVSIPGWASVIVILTFFFALILLCLAIIVLYILRINQQITRTRINYAVAEMHE